MSAEPIECVSWRGANGFGSRHLAKVGDSRTLCMRVVPRNVRVDRGCTRGELCRGCVVVLDKTTAARLTLETQTEARQKFAALRLERDERGNG